MKKLIITLLIIGCGVSSAVEAKETILKSGRISFGENVIVPAAQAIPVPMTGVQSGVAYNVVCNLYDENAKANPIVMSFNVTDSSGTVRVGSMSLNGAPISQQSTLQLNNSLKILGVQVRDPSVAITFVNTDQPSVSNSPGDSVIIESCHADPVPIKLKH